jgi:hypothetical protein
MTDVTVQHVCSKYSFKLGTEAADTFRVSEVALSELVVWPQVFESFSKLKICVTPVEDIKCLGHALLSEIDGNVDLLSEPVLKNRRISLLCVKLLTRRGVSFGSFQRGLKGNQNTPESSF